MFNLRKAWMYRVRATPQQCEQAFTTAFTTKRSVLSPKRAHWSVSRQQVPTDSGHDAPAVVATMDRPNALRMMSQAGRAGAGSSIAFSVVSYDETSKTTECQMFLLEGKRFKHNNITPAVVANADMLKAQMKLVHRKLKELDPNLGHDKSW